MTLTTSTTTQDQRAIRLIDRDVHQEFHAWEDLRLYLGPA